MAIHLNIGSRSTIRYRTDCFDTGSRTDFHLYKSPNIHVPDAINNQDDYYYDVGSYGKLRDNVPWVRNTTICDNLLMNGSFQDPSVVSDSVYYEELLFTRPMIALYRSSTSGYRGAVVTMSADTFLVIDRLYTDLQGKRCMGEGTAYTNGTQSTFSGVFDTPIINTQESIKRMSLLLETHPNNGMVLDNDSWAYIVNADELKSFFPNGNRYSAFWNQISQCEYGACYVWNRTSVLDAAPMVIRYQVETQSGNIEVSNFPYGSTGFFKFYYIIPFVSQDEYNAAYAANYPWSTARNGPIEIIQKYYFNKFK